MTIQDIDEPVDSEITVTSKTTTRDALFAARTAPILSQLGEENAPPLRRMTNGTTTPPKRDRSGRIACITVDGQWWPTTHTSSRPQDGVTPPF
jgi:hypothetical protein